MRRELAFLLCLMSGCVGPVNFRTQPGADLTVRPRAAHGAQFPALLLDVDNISHDEVCIRAEAAKNPHTQEITVRLRDRRGRELRRVPAGYVLPPLEGVVKMRPGEHVGIEVPLRGRFVLSANWTSSVASARILLPYRRCAGGSSVVADSGWQRL
jgi:hypothetical protein